MDGNYTQIALAITSMIAPFTPYLVEGGKKFSGKAGEAAWEKATLVWGKLKSNLDYDTKIKGATLVLSADPDDKDSQILLVKALATRLQENPKLAQELLELVGGKDALQQVLADKDSRIEDVTQDIDCSGTQVVKASKNSVIKGVRQSKKS